MLILRVISCPLLQWLSHQEIQDESVKDQLRILWAESLNCLRSQPPLTFDSSFLKLQACLLEKALGHPNTLISDPTYHHLLELHIWQANQLGLSQNLLHVLDNLSRSGRINLYNRSKSFLARCSMLENNTVPRSCKVTATQNMSSKRVELMEGRIAEFNQKDKPPPYSI
ncbi:hypothetical protein CRYUN_Cryun03dG0073900 [Craigia yunnanensis]